jgi:hypothetical protein
VGAERVAGVKQEDTHKATHSPTARRLGADAIRDGRE